MHQEQLSAEVARPTSPQVEAADRGCVLDAALTADVAWREERKVDLERRIERIGTWRRRIERLSWIPLIGIGVPAVLALFITLGLMYADHLLARQLRQGSYQCMYILIAVNCVFTGVDILARRLQRRLRERGRKEGIEVNPEGA